jgi:capping protein (actin filament) muscle Z-line, beta
MEQEQNQKKYKNCLHLYKLLSPKNSDANFNVISELIYEDDDNLSIFTQKVEVPSNVCKDDPLGPFLCCEFNRDGDSYRSPISNKYYPTPEEGLEMKFLPTQLRNLEIKFNKIFQSYIRAYYNQNAICSVYLDTSDDNLENGFLANIRIKSPIKDKIKMLDSGCWDSNNIVEVKFIHDKPNVKVEYRISSSAYLTLEIDNEESGKLCASGYSIKTVRLFVYC